ncbi:MAG: metallophosphoesterase [Candidatus Hodarchaeota archaeon]
MPRSHEEQAQARLRVAAVADVHSPKYLKEFKISLSGISKPDVFILAGDMINFGKVTEYKNILDAIDSALGRDFPIVACFGNEEPDAVRDEILGLVGDRIRFLDEQAFQIDLEGAILGIAGAATLVPARVTTNHDGIRDLFEERIERLSSLLAEVKKTSTHTILVMHYSPLREDDPKTLSRWVSEVVAEHQPNVLVHGHLHSSASLEITISGIRVVNVAFPATGKITELQILMGTTDE